MYLFFSMVYMFSIKKQHIIKNIYGTKSAIATVLQVISGENYNFCHLFIIVLINYFYVYCSSSETMYPRS